MTTQTLFIPVALAVYAFVAVLIFLVTRTSDFKRQSEDDKARARKQFKIGLIGMPVAMIGGWLLLGASSQVINRIPVFLYFGLWLFVACLTWRGYRLGIKRDHRLVKARSGKPLRSPEALVGIFAKINFGMAAALAVFLVLIPLAKISFSMWVPWIAAIAGVFSFISSRVERNNEA